MASRRLTKEDRAHIVTRVLQDVPQTDYQEQVRSIVTKAFVDELPPSVRALYDNPATSGYVCTGTHSINFGYQTGGYVTVVVPCENRTARALNAKAGTAVAALLAANEVQHKKLEALRTSLTGALAAFTTRKQLVEAMPEFEKYAPPEEVKASNLPALANVMADLSKAGWPKGKKPDIEPAKKGGAK